MTEPQPNATGEPVLLAVRDLCVDFAAGKRINRVVDHVSFDLRRNETLGLVGQSGSGKSMTALAMMGLLQRNRLATVSGSAKLDGAELIGMHRREASKYRGDRIAMVFQDPMSSLNPVFTVGEQIGETLRTHKGMSRKDAKTEAVRLLDLVGIPGASRRIDSYPFEFSGGMRQRVMTAMAVSCDPAVLIADEPTTALDVTVQAQILELLRSLQREIGMAILFITHDLAVVSDLCDRVAVMYAGQLVEETDTLRLFDQPLHPYTEGLLCSTPDYLGLGERVRSNTGAFPTSGCRFAPRCPNAQDRCTAADVELRTDVAGDSHSVRCVRAHELHLDSASALWARAEGNLG